MIYVSHKLKELSTADLAVMIERIESGKCLYNSLVQDVKERLLDELDGRILIFVENDDRILDED